jgi:DNA-binding NarL/FixJ family response regulator
MIQTIMVRKVLEDPSGWLENSANHSFVALIFRIDMKGMGGLRALGLLTSWIFLLEIECNKTLIQTIMVRKVLEDPSGWLENSVNHSFVALISRIDLMGMGGLRVLGLLTSWIFLLEIECNKTMIQTQMVRKRLDDPRRWLDSSVRDSINHSLFLK